MDSNDSLRASSLIDACPISKPDVVSEDRWLVLAASEARSGTSKKLPGRSCRSGFQPGWANPDESPGRLDLLDRSAAVAASVQEARRLRDAWLMEESLWP